LYAYKGEPPTAINDIRPGTTAITDNAFDFHSLFSLTSITIPGSVTDIGNNAFGSGFSLTSINVDADNPNYASQDGILYNKAKTYIICIPRAISGSITIPSGVTSIDYQTFSGCYGLTSINVDADDPNYASQDGILYNKAKTYIICIPRAISDSITIPNSVTTIGDYAFSGCTGLTSATFESGSQLTSIENFAFQNCTGLTSITIPNSVTSIGSYAFYYCTGLTSITIPAGVTSINSSAFSGCTGLTSVIFESNSQLTSIGGFAFYDCTGLTSITIPNSVTSIGDYAFQNCTGLTSITIPDSVTSIGDYAFNGCTGLTIYVEAASEPAGWNTSWNYSNRPVVWGCTLSADKTYVVSFTKSASNPVRMIAAPYREGYTCGGWATTEGGTTAAYPAFDLMAAPNDTTLYAIWTPI
jgi:uncharacterized repeat protein (TIGR02543 family)